MLPTLSTMSARRTPGAMHGRVHALRPQQLGEPRVHPEVRPPVAEDADHGEGGREQQPSSQHRIGEDCGERSDAASRAAIGMSPRRNPRFGLAAGRAARRARGRGNGASEERVAPVAADQILEQDRGEEAGAGGRLQNARGDGARRLRKDLGNHRRARAPLAADAERRDEAQDQQLRRRLGQARQPGEHRVDQDRQRHRPRAAPSIGDHAEEQAARRPADERDAERPPAPHANRRAASRRARAAPPSRGP